MKFSNDRQRKAVFANMSTSRFAASPYSVVDRMNMGEFSSEPAARIVKSDLGVGFVKDEKMIEGAKGFKLPEKKTYDLGTSGKGMTEQMDEFIEKNKRGVSLGQYATDEKQFALKSLNEIKKEYEDIWDSGTTNEVLKPVHKFLRKYSKSKRPEVSSWAKKELSSFYSDSKTEREEALMEDPSKGTDPDWDAPDGTIFDDYSEY